MPVTGRTVFFTDNWKGIQASQQVLDIIHGYKIPFVEEPSQHFHPSTKAVPWSGHLSYAFPLISQIMKCLKKIQTNKTKVLFVAPVWRSRPWFPVLLSMLYDCPLLLPNCFGSVDTTILPREAPAETSDSGRVAAVWKCLLKFSLLSRVSEIVMSSWRSRTQAQYGSVWAKWSSWCVQQQEDTISCNLNCFLEFLAELFDAGLQYRTI